MSGPTGRLQMNLKLPVRQDVAPSSSLAAHLSESTPLPDCRAARECYFTQPGQFRPLSSSPTGSCTTTGAVVVSSLHGERNGVHSCVWGLSEHVSVTARRKPVVLPGEQTKLLKLHIDLLQVEVVGLQSRMAGKG